MKAVGKSVAIVGAAALLLGTGVAQGNAGVASLSNAERKADTAVTKSTLAGIAKVVVSGWAVGSLPNKGSVKGPAKIPGNDYLVPKRFSLRWNSDKMTFCVQGKVGKSRVWHYSQKTRGPAKGKCP